MAKKKSVKPATDKPLEIDPRYQLHVNHLFISSFVQWMGTFHESIGVLLTLDAESDDADYHAWRAANSFCLIQSDACSDAAAEFHRWHPAYTLANVRIAAGAGIDPAIEWQGEIKANYHALANAAGLAGIYGILNAVELTGGTSEEIGPQILEQRELLAKWHSRAMQGIDVKHLAGRLDLEVAVAQSVLWEVWHDGHANAGMNLPPDIHQRRYQPRAGTEASKIVKQLEKGNTNRNSIQDITGASAANVNQVYKRWSGKSDAL